MAELKDILGPEFASRYYAGRRTQLQLDRHDIYSLKKMIKEGRMDPESASLTYLKGSYKYEIILVEMPQELRTMQTRNPLLMKVSGRWRGQWVNIMTSPVNLSKMLSKGTYFVAGNLKINEYQGKESYSFFANAVFTLDEIAGFDPNEPAPIITG
jgi:hypothetical protein